jgi:hypothetical protein
MNAADNKAVLAKTYPFPGNGPRPAPLPRVVVDDDEKPASPAARKSALWRGRLEQARRTLAPSMLLLVWDVDRLSAVAAWKHGKNWLFSEEASSTLGDFAPALNEALGGLRRMGIKPPRQCTLAARFIVPARVDLPVSPEKPRPFLQMREIVRAEMEAPLAENGALWSIGAILAARGRIDADARERIALELAMRREQSNRPIFFGQLAVDLGLVSKDEIQEALAVQEKLQTLEAVLACGWTGYKTAPGEPPVWLGSATGFALWRQVETACKRCGLKLLGGLPLIWSASETEDDACARVEGNAEEGAEDAREGESNRISLEIHPEDVVAVLRHRGRIVSARAEGRLGAGSTPRPLDPGWLLRLVADWRANGAAALEILCFDARDEARIEALLEEFTQHWGQPLVFRKADETRHALLECLARQHGARLAPLPAIRFSEPPRPIWKRAGFWQLACLLAVIAIASWMEIDQRAKIKAIQTRFDLTDLESKRQANLKQQESVAMLAARKEKDELDVARKLLVEVVPENERLQAIENMAYQLPRLLRTLADNIGDDVVLETVRNSRSGGIGDVMVVGWTNSYGSAQSFAQRVQQALSGLGYAVAQTDVTTGPGRDGRSGYFVSFWLLPRAPVEELGEDEANAPGTPVKTPPTAAKTQETAAKTPETPAPEAPKAETQGGTQ